MMKLVAAATLAAALALAAGPTAANGCYNADGKPTGAAYVLAAPDMDWIRYV